LLPKKADFVFIDGQKSQYAEYMEIIETLISDTTILVLDDVIKYHNKLDTLYRFLEKKQINYEIKQLEPDDGVMVIIPKGIMN
jgi:predicted O-methyltransferase YrrM